MPSGGATPGPGRGDMPDIRIAVPGGAVRGVWRAMVQCVSPGGGGMG